MPNELAKDGPKKPAPPRFPEGTTWPGWYYGPNGAADIFNGPDEVPEGWEDHPSKVGEKPAAPKKPVAPTGKKADAGKAASEIDDKVAALKKDLEGMKRADLVELATEKGLQFPPDAAKDDLIQLILKAATDGDGN